MKQDRTDAEVRGLRCRECGCAHLRVIYTRRVSGQKLIRRRECRHCGHRLTTYERQVGLAD